MGKDTGTPVGVGNHEWDATDQARQRKENANPSNPTDAAALIDLRAKLARGGLTAGERATVQAQIDAIEAKRPAPASARAENDAQRLADLRAQLAAGNCTDAECATISAEITALEAHVPAAPHVSAPRRHTP